jgi:hypothetical protein
MKARACESRQVVPPRVPAFGKAVTQEYERARALFGDVDVQAVGPHMPVLDRAGHRCRPALDVRRPGRLNSSRESDARRRKQLSSR